MWDTPMCGAAAAHPHPLTAPASSANQPQAAQQGALSPLWGMAGGGAAALVQGAATACHQ